MATFNQSPIIGITTYGRNEVGQFHLYASYVDTVRRAGGVPMLLPPGETQFDRLINAIDGLIFTGGGDIAPDQYSGTYHHTIYNTDPERDDFELELARQALKSSIPILGICRGLQVLSVASGSKLVPHVPDVFGTCVLHRGEPLRSVRHAVDVLPGSRLASIVNVSSMEVVSWHHQAVPAVPSGWQAIAHAPDGLIEALEHETHPWAIALQWHPELSAADDPLQQQIFEALVAVSQEGAATPAQMAY